MNQAFWNTLNVGLFALQDCLALLAVLFVGRYFYRVTTKIKIEDQIISGNNAMGITKAGFLIGLAIASTGGIWTVPDMETKSLMIGIIGLFSMILLRLSLVVNDKIILSKFNNLREIVDNQNIGLAFVEAGGTIATGLMIAGAMSGKSDSLLEKLEYGAFYWLVGQVILVLCGRIHNAICGYDIDAELGKKNIAVGVAFGGFLMAVGIVTNASMYGVSTNFADEIVTIGVLVAIGISLLVLGKFALAKVVLPKTKLSEEIGRDGNAGAAAISSVAFIALAVIFSASIAPATTSAAFGSAPPIDDFVDETAIVAPSEPTSDIKPAIEIKAPIAKPEPIPEPKTEAK